MLQLGYISQAEYQKAVAEPINLNMPNRDLNNIHPYAGEMVRSELVKHFGEQAIDSGYKVYTTINAKRQAIAEKLCRTVLKLMTVVMAVRAEAHDKPLRI